MYIKDSSKMKIQRPTARLERLAAYALILIVGSAGLGRTQELATNYHKNSVGLIYQNCLNSRQDKIDLRNLLITLPQKLKTKPTPTSAEFKIYVAEIDRSIPIVNCSATLKDSK
jgi:hypothetical protein